MTLCRVQILRIIIVIVVLVAGVMSAVPEKGVCSGLKTVSPKLSLPAAARSSERLYNLPGLSNVGLVAQGVLRGAEVSKEGYATLKAMGVKTVIGMRTTASEKKEVEAAGMKAIAVPIEMSRDGLKKKVDEVVALMADPANQPVYVHCRHGQDRTGIVVAAFRMKQQGWSLADAETEMQAFGFNDVWVNYKKFIRGYGNGLANSGQVRGAGHD